MRKRDNKKNRRPEQREFRLDDWNPKTKTGKMVKSGDITSIEQIYEKNLPILESEIIDVLVPNLQDELLKLRMVQRTTDSGRKGSFMATVVVGNKNGYVGVGTAKGNEVRPTIEKAVKEGKKNLIHIRRGCGSWECNCNEEHSIPFKVHGRESSVKIELMPAPKGTGITGGRTAKKILDYAGVKDVWSHSLGNTRTVFNSAFSTLDALKHTRTQKLQKG